MAISFFALLLIGLVFLLGVIVVIAWFAASKSSSAAVAGCATLLGGALLLFLVLFAALFYVRGNHYEAEYYPPTDKPRASGSSYPLVEAEAQVARDEARLDRPIEILPATDAASPSPNDTPSDETSSADTLPDDTLPDGPGLPAEPEPTETAAPADTDVDLTPSDIVIPPGRPDWVESPPRRVNDAFQVAVSSDPYKTNEECSTALFENIDKAIEAYVNNNPQLALGQKLSPARLRRLAGHVERVDTYGEQLESPSVGPMMQKHTLLQFDRSFDQEVEYLARQQILTQRISYLGIGLGGVLLVLTTIFFALKIPGKEQAISAR